jgi:hypothetical protein
LSSQLTAAWLQFPVALSQPSVVQRSLSLQSFGAWAQPVVAEQESTVQALLSSQLVAGPGTQAPLAHTSPVVQALLSLHGAVLNVLIQAPVPVLQLSVVQTLLSSQLLGVPAVQLPIPSHVSLSVQALLSVQLVVFRKLKAWQRFGLSMSQALNLQLARPYVQPEPARATHWPELLHAPSQGSVPKAGRHAAPAGAAVFTHAPLKQLFAHPVPN